jgi:hypothetical protein
LCKLKQEKLQKFSPRLAFVSYDCMEKNESLTPIIALIYREEEKRGNFTKYLFSENFLDINDTKEVNSLYFEYFLNEENFQNKLPPLTHDFKINLQHLMVKPQVNLIDKIIQFVLDLKWSNTTYVCQDVSSTFLTAILKALLSNGICPKVIRKQNKILVIEIKPLNVRFITSNAYLLGDEYDLARQFEIKFDYYFFPSDFLSHFYLSNYDSDSFTPCTINSEWNENTPCKNKILPNESYFFSKFDSELTIQNKKEFLKNFNQNNKKWCLEKEIVIFNDQKLYLLTIACLTFVKESFEFQKLLLISQKKSELKILHPFSFPLCSLSGFIFKVFKLFYLNNYNIYCVANEFKSNRNCSKIEFEWSCVMDFLHPEKLLLSEFNNELGQFYFTEAIPDLYSVNSKTAYFFNGCKIHSHLSSDCKFNKKCTEASLNPFGKSFKEVNEIFFSKMENLLLNNSNKINEIIIEWECQYLRRKKDPLIQSFLELQFKDQFGDHPRYRLQARTAVRGAYFDIFALKWDKKLYPNEKFIYVDCNALYSFVCAKYPFMTGKYKVIMGAELKKIEIQQNLFYFENKKISGAVLLTILPPNDLFLPFLLYRRNKDSKTFNTLCRMCCENESVKCSHSRKQRALTSTYMISEIEYALSLNYEIISIYEAHIYTDSPEFIFKDFVEKLNFFKTKNSNCFSKCQTLKDKEDCCKKLNQKMNLNEPFILSPENVKFNASKRNFYKLCNNALFGKFSEKRNKSQTIFASNSNEIEQIFFSDKKIEEIFCINENICEISITPSEFSLNPNRNSNCYLGAEIIALARQTIHKYATLINNLNFPLYQINCDSLLFSMPNNETLPIEISEAMGDFKFEIKGEILSYYSLGTKSYCINYKDPNGSIKTNSKICGISLKSKASNELIDNKLFDFYISQILANKQEKILIQQERFKRNLKKFKVSQNLVNVSFSNHLSTRRVVDLNEPNLKTFPYGFLQEQ